MPTLTLVHINAIQACLDAVDPYEGSDGNDSLMIYAGNMHSIAVEGLSIIKATMPLVEEDLTAADAEDPLERPGEFINGVWIQG